jgi:hypothetical protein
MKRDSNPYQTWSRLRQKCTIALRDMSLLARTLPDDKQEEIFNDLTIIPLVNFIVNSMVESSEESDCRRTKIAASLAGIAIKKCISQYEKLVPNEVLRKPMVDKLHECVSYCNHISIEIGNKPSKGLKLMRPQNSGEHKRSHYFSPQG